MKGKKKKTTISSIDYKIDKLFRLNYYKLKFKL